jgi:hypothetical protein
VIAVQVAELGNPVQVGLVLLLLLLQQAVLLAA